jgi:hypothetical protein
VEILDLEKNIQYNIIGLSFYILGRYLELAEETNTKTEEVISFAQVAIGK